MFLEGDREDTRIQCFPKMVAQNSKMDARAIKPLQSVDAAGDNGNVAPQQAGGGKDGRSYTSDAADDLRLVCPGRAPEEKRDDALLRGEVTAK